MHFFTCSSKGCSLLCCSLCYSISMLFVSQIFYSPQTGFHFITARELLLNSLSRFRWWRIYINCQFYNIVINWSEINIPVCCFLWANQLIWMYEKKELTYQSFRPLLVPEPLLLVLNSVNVSVWEKERKERISI